MDTEPARVTIYHNPGCGTSRNVLALIQASGIEPVIVDYLNHPPEAQTLRSLADQAGLSIRDMLRIKGTPYMELGLDAPNLDDDHLLEQMQRHPILINRPFVAASTGVRLCRPSDLVFDLLPRSRSANLAKEDGSLVLVDTPVAGADPQLHAALIEAGLPTGDLSQPGRRFFRYETLADDGVGFAGFELYGRDVLLRSLVVPAAQRKQGMGRSILALLTRRAFDAGARKAWLLTTTASGFFERGGFKPADRESAPTSILGTRQATGLCPASAALLSRSISL
jgi:arsenate reductase